MTTIIDVQQILMQEPRVSWKAAQLIEHPAFVQELIREKRAQERSRKSGTVTRTDRIAAKTAIANKNAAARVRGRQRRPDKRGGHIDISV